MKKIFIFTIISFFCCNILFAVSITEELTQLNNLYKEGAITKEEFSKAKSLLLKTNNSEESKKNKKSKKIEKNKKKDSVTNKTETKITTNKKGKQIDLIFCKYNNALQSNQQKDFPQSVYLNFKEEGCNKYVNSTGLVSKFSKKESLEISYEVFLKKRKKFYGICYSEQLKKISYKKNCHKKESFVKIINKDGSFENINITKTAKKDSQTESKKSVEKPIKDKKK